MRWQLPMLGVVLLVVLACVTQARQYPATQKLGDTPITAKWTKVVRGVSGTACDAVRIGDGNQPKVGPREDLTDLSISCSDEKSVTLDKLRQPLPNPHICWSTLDDLRKARKEVTVVRDPTDGNPYHCLLATITPKEFVSRAFWKN